MANGWRQIRFVDFHGDGTQNQIERDDESSAAFFALHDSFEALKWAAHDARAPSSHQVRVRFKAMSVDQAQLEACDFLVAQGSRLAIESHQACHAGDLQNLQAVAEREPHKYVARKKSQAQPHAAILPAMNCFVERQECFDRPLLEMVPHPFFMLGASVCCVPVRLEPSEWHWSVFFETLTMSANGCHLHPVLNPPDTASPRHLHWRM